MPRKIVSLLIIDHKVLIVCDKETVQCDAAETHIIVNIKRYFFVKSEKEFEYEL